MIAAAAQASGELSVARLAIIVSALVTVLAPIVAALIQGWLGRRHERTRQAADHASWLRDRRATVYVEAIGMARGMVVEAREMLKPNPDLDRLLSDPEPDNRRIDAELRAFGSPAVRIGLQAVFLAETAVIEDSDASGKTERLAQLTEELADEVDRFSDLVASEIQSVAADPE